MSLAVQQLLTRLREDQIVLRVENEQIKVSAPTGGIGPAVLEEIRENRTDIIQFFQKFAQRTATGSIPLLEEQESYETSYAQKRLWILDQFAESKGAYNIPYAIQLDTELAPQALEQAFATIIDRHESLRTVFVSVAGEPRQQILDPEAIDWTIEWSSLGAGKSTALYIQKVLAEESAYPFDLALGPLFRVRVIDCGTAGSVLIFFMHLILYDGWSRDVLIREFQACYSHFLGGSRLNLPPLPFQYKEFSVWQNQKLEQSNYLGQYWRKQLGGELPILSLATDYPRPATKSFRGNTYSITLPEVILTDLRQLSSEQHTTLFISLLAVLNTFLFKYTGQKDLIIGTPITGRDYPGLENQIGFYVNTLPIRSRFSEEDSFLDLLQRTKAEVLGAFEHQDYPFNKMVEDLEIPRDTSRSPLFDISFSVNENGFPGATTAESAATVAPQAKDLELESTSSKFDLMFNFSPTLHGLHINVGYATDLFAESSIARMVQHLKHLLFWLTANPDQPIRSASVLSTAQQSRLRAEQSINYPAYTEGRPVGTLFSNLAQQSPTQAAIVDQEGILSYGELEAESNRLAHWLRDQYQLQPNDRVGLVANRDRNLLISILGIIKAGGTYVPIDPQHPAPRIEFMLQDTQVKLLLTHQEDFLDGFEQQVPALPIEDARLQAQGYLETRPPEANQVTDTLYVIYTSGSTGKPKGVPVPHRGILRLTQDQNYVDIQPGDRVSQLSNYAFDGSVFDIFGALLNGATLYMVPKETMLSIQALGQFLVEHKINICLITTALFNTLVDFVPESIRHIDYLLFGGEEASPKHIQIAHQYLKSDGLLLNAYGPTECSVIATYFPIRSEKDAQAPVPIGKPIGQTDLLLLDPYQQPVPFGQMGEICLGGPGLADGYLNRPDITANRFIPHPLTEGKWLYKTGDLGRFRSDGHLLFEGRIDRQVKVRGNRIEIGEIEVALNQLSAIRRSLVIVDEDTFGTKHLIGYLETDEELDLAQLSQQLGETLPNYMIPGQFVLLNQFPINPNGKLDRKALPAPSYAANPASASYLAPRNETEALVASIWTEMLGQEQISVTDDFFLLGGHSLKATRVLARIQQETDIHLSLTDLFAQPTIQGLASLIEQKDQSERIPTVEIQSSYPLSHAQKRLWIIDHFEESKGAYNIPHIQLIQGEIDPVLLQKTLDALVARFEVLRTTFFSWNNTPRQLIHAAADFPIEVVWKDFRAVADREQAVSQYLQTASVASFDLETGPLLRLEVLQLQAEQQLLFLNIHHIISDGWSMEVMMKQLMETYQAYSEGNPLAQAPLAIQYKDFAVWQNQLLESKQAQSHRAYWQKQLSGELPILNLPTDYPRPPFKMYEGRVAMQILAPEMAIRLEQIAQETGASMFMALLGVTKLLLHKYTGQEDLMVGTLISGRDYAGLEDQIGFFVNTLPLRTQIDQENSFHEFLHQVKKGCLDAFEHQVYPFDLMVEEIEVERDLSRSPLFDVLVSMQAFEIGEEVELDEAAAGSPIEVQDIETETTISKFDLSWSFAVSQQGLEVGVEYATHLFKPERIEQMLTHFEFLLQSILREPEKQLGELAYLPSQEQAAIVSLGKGPILMQPERSRSHLLAYFEEQAELHPQRIGLVWEAQSWTYEALNQRANQLAHYLHVEYGVGPHQIVALLLEREDWMVIGMLATLKLGAAYLPIEPHYPQQRIDFILEDVAPHLICAADEAAVRLRENTPVLLQSQLPICSQNQAVHNPEVAIEGHQLAYLIYTSGSTGSPKGVAISHANACALIDWGRETFDADLFETVFAATSYCFDLSVFELFFSLAMGKRIRLLRSALEISEYLPQERKVLLNTVPSVVSNLLKLQIDWSAVSVLNMAGEPIPQSVIDQLDLYRIQVRNLYGPSEDTTYSTCHLFDERKPEVVIGRPIAQTQAFIMDPAQHLQPRGSEGEIVLSGAGLALGYLNRPELTAQKFPSHSVVSGERVYLTGDLGKWNHRGELLFRGRKDHQVKVRGHRIELGEIEATLMAQKVIQHALVSVSEVGPQEELGLVAYYTAPEALSEDHLIMVLRERLPTYMVPDIFIHLSAFPLNANGKIDRKALPKPEQQTDVTNLLAPRTELEQQVFLIWQDILGAKVLGIRQNFFRIGGHSLKATQMVARIRQELNLSINLKDIFEYPTVESLAGQLQQYATSDIASA